MKTTFWQKVDTTIILLNKMESLLSLILMFTGAHGYINQKPLWINISILIILIGGIMVLVGLFLFMWRKTNDSSFIRTYFSSDEWKKLKKDIDFNLVAITGNSNKREIRRTQLINNAVLNILETRRNLTYRYVEKLILNLIEDENLKDFRE